MVNPWINIPLSEYEGHMNSPEVQQLEALADLFGEALERCKPASVAILGIAGGNGLDRIDNRVTKRIVGIDLNPVYLDAVRQRYPDILDMELHCVDLAESMVEVEPVQLVHVALVFEHAGIERCLDNALSLVAPGGILSVVLQLPSPIVQGVAPSAFPSMQNLKSHFSLIDPDELCHTLVDRGFGLTRETQRSLVARKSFWMGLFGRE
jgi:hypothetical protein